MKSSSPRKVQLLEALANFSIHRDSTNVRMMKKLIELGTLIPGSVVYRS